MTDELDWVLEQFADVATAVATEYTLDSGDPVQLERVNRDESRKLEEEPSSIHGELQRGVFVGATHVNTDRNPVGTEYDVDREVIIGVRVTGLTEAKYGHIDPSGEDGVPFTRDGGIVERLKNALWAERQWPDANPREEVYYKDLEIQNEANASELWADYYRADWDVVFDGYEEL